MARCKEAACKKTGGRQPRLWLGLEKEEEDNSDTSKNGSDAEEEDEIEILAGNDATLEESTTDGATAIETNINGPDPSIGTVNIDVRCVPLIVAQSTQDYVPLDMAYPPCTAQPTTHQLGVSLNTAQPMAQPQINMNTFIMMQQMMQQSML